ncbi:Ig domain-containing protein [Myxococcota bacterium]|nr:Ig domain-containing protein [Myxococcota bacterium]
MRRIKVVRMVWLLLGLLALAWSACNDGKSNNSEDPCQPDTVRCSDNVVERCLLSGSGWQVEKTCGDAETCVEGLCLANACEPGERLCAEIEVVYECAGSGTSWTRSPCPGFSKCLMGECLECVNAEGCEDGFVCDQGKCVSGALSITTEALPEGIVGVPYETGLQAALGVAPYTWALAGGTLPEGLALDAGTGSLAGSPAVAGDFLLEVTVTDADGATDSRSLPLRIRGEGMQILTASTLPPAEEGNPWELQLQAAGGLMPYGWMLAQGALPAGLDLYADGRIAGTPTEIGTFPFEVKVFDSLEPPQFASKAMTLVVSIAPLVIVGETEYDFYVTKIIVLDMIFPYFPYAGQLQATGGLRPYQWEEQEVPSVLAGMLQLSGVDASSWGVPEGLTLAPDGAITGSKSSVDDAQTLTLPVTGISVTGYFFYARVTDSQFPAVFREAAFVIPTIPLTQP